MSSFTKSWMMFVDGENLSKRARAVMEAKAVNPDDTKAVPNYIKDVLFWPPNKPPFHSHWSKRGYMAPEADRCHYYTSTPGDEQERLQIHDKLSALGFFPTVFHRAKSGRSKGVDITLTKDMLLHAFYRHYEIAVLVSGDGDYVPVVQEVQRQGRQVIVAFFANEGLNPDLRRAADEFCPLDI